MSAELPDPAEDLLRDVLAGDRREDDPAVRQLLQERPELRARLDRLRALAADLDEAGAHQREILAGQHGEQDVPHLDVRALRQRLARRRHVLWMVAAAAVLCLGVGVWWVLLARPVGNGERSDGTLAATDLVLAREFVPGPEGLRALVWKDPIGLAPGFEYVVHVFGDTTSFDEELSAVCSEPRWIPKPEVLTSLSNPFWYQIEIRPLGGRGEMSSLIGPVYH